LIEEVMITGMQAVEQVMVRSPLEAKPWHRVAHCRNDMLSNSFSVLPILTGPERWELLSDEAIVQMVAGTTRRSVTISFQKVWRMQYRAEISF